MLFLLLIVVPASVGARRRKLIKVVPLSRPPKPIIFVQEIPQIMAAEVQKHKEPAISDTDRKEEQPQVIQEVILVPPPPPVPRLLYVASDEHDGRDLIDAGRNFEFECSSCSVLNTDPSDCDIIVLSNMEQVPQIVSQQDAFKQVVLWVRGRCSDEEYEVIRGLALRNNVHLVVCTPYEKAYMKNKGIVVDRAVVIWPTYNQPTDRTSLLLPNGLQEFHSKRIMTACVAQGIHLYDYASRGMGMIERALCFPGSMPEHLVQEHLQQGVLQFVPTIRFLKRLGFVSRDRMNMIHTSKWYDPEFADCIQYFNSWNDLKIKLLETDYGTLVKRMQQLGQERDNLTMSWKELLEEFLQKKF